MTGSTELAAARAGALDLITHVLLRCGGRPDGSLVVVMFSGSEDVADDAPLVVVDLSHAAGGETSFQVVQRLRQAVTDAGAERVGLIAFDSDLSQMGVITGTVAIALGLPAQRLLVAEDIWLDADRMSVTGSTSQVAASRAAVSAVLEGVALPGGAA